VIDVKESGEEIKSTVAKKMFQDVERVDGRKRRDAQQV
jgi:hypothetical protein